MFVDRSALYTSLLGLVGFNNADDPNYPTLVPSLITSRSGRTFNQVHSLLTIENIDQCIKNFSQYTYPNWNVGTEYSLGQKVTNGTNSYEYINQTASTGNALTNATYWRQIDALSDFLIKSIYRGIDEMIDAYIDSKSLTGKVKALFQDVLLFHGSGNYRNLEINQDKFVGLRIRFKKGERHLTSIINKIGHQFSKVIGSGETLTIKLYHDSQQQPLATWDIEHGAANSSRWTSLTTNNIMKYVNDDLHDIGGDFYIGYKQSELAALTGSPQAVNKDVYWSSKPCDCEPRWSNYWKQYSPYIEVLGFSVNESDMPADVMFQPEQAHLSNIVNYGLNLNLTTKCDLVPFFLQEESILSRPLSYAVGLVLLEEMANTTRKGNTLANQVKVEAAKQLYHHKEAWGTVYDKFHKSIKTLSFDFSDMENTCMPSDNPMRLHTRRRSV